MGKLILCIGLIGLSHAAFSATQHRKYLRLSERDFTSLPADILAQTLLSLLLCSIACVFGIAKTFKKIHITSEWESKSWDNIANRTSFYSFNHRGKYLFSSEIYDEDLVNIKKLQADELDKEEEIRANLLKARRQKEHAESLGRQEEASTDCSDEDTESSTSSEIE